MKKTNLLLTLLFFTQLLQAQTLTGHYKQHAGQELSLTGFNYYKSTTLGTAKADSSGFFIINYPKGYKGDGHFKCTRPSEFSIGINSR